MVAVGDRIECKLKYFLFGLAVLPFERVIQWGGIDFLGSLHIFPFFDKVVCSGKHRWFCVAKSIFK